MISQHGNTTPGKILDVKSKDSVWDEEVTSMGDEQAYYKKLLSILYPVCGVAKKKSQLFLKN